MVHWCTVPLAQVPLIPLIQVQPVPGCGTDGILVQWCTVHTGTDGTLVHWHSVLYRTHFLLRNATDAYQMNMVILLMMIKNKFSITVMMMTMVIMMMMMMMMMMRINDSRRETNIAVCQIYSQSEWKANYICNKCKLGADADGWGC